MVSFSGAFRRFGLGALAMAALSAVANAEIKVRSLEERASSTDRLVFAHMIIGTISDRTSAADYNNDMQLAAKAGIDAFAADIGTDSFTDTQLGYLYEAAANNNMKVFLSFDFSYWSTSNPTAVGQKIAQYAKQPAQLYVNNAVFASSFIGDGLDVSAMKAAAGVPVFFAPNFHPGESSASSIDGALNWLAWDSNGSGYAPTPGHNYTVVDGDNDYQNWLGSGKSYMAPVSPWFSTHYGPAVSYSKNFVYPSGALWYWRWAEILEQNFPMLEIITWNDFGESSYVGPLSSKHWDDTNSQWANDMPHDGFLTMAAPFIAAYKNKATDVSQYITEDQVVYWYRRNPKNLDCDATDTTANAPANNASGLYFEGKPNGWNTMEDDIYVVTLLTAAATLTVTTGGVTTSYNVPAGAKLTIVPFSIGQQTFTLSRNGQTVYSGTSLMDITDVCNCGIYNFNAYVGTLPPGPSDPLGPDGLVSLTVGLHVTTCHPTPSLGTNPPVATVPATTTKAAASPTTTTKAAASPSATQYCVAGTVAPGESANYTGLCNYACAYNYCPVGPCVCTKYSSTPNAVPASNGKNGCPLSNEASGYIGLCSFCCNHNYCPTGACEYC